jgi:hypothetical protein
MSAYTEAIQIPDVATLLANVSHGDAKARAEAVAAAPLIGWKAIAGLAEVYRKGDPAATHTAAYCLSRIAHHAARFGATTERAEAATALVPLIKTEQPQRLRIDALYLLGFVGGSSEVSAVAEILGDLILREYARLALERIPGGEADNALQKAWTRAGDDYRSNIEQSLRARSVRRRR